MGQFYDKGLGGIRDRAAKLNKEQWLERWWEKKNKTSWRHNEHLAKYTREELLLEFMQDYIEKFPQQAMALGAGEDVQFITGDPVIDKLEHDLAAGKECPDLIDLFVAPGEAEQLKAYLNREKERVAAFYATIPAGSIAAEDTQVDSIETNEAPEQPFFGEKG